MVQIPLDKEKITAFCQHWKIARLALFGSVLRPDFGPHSDVDLLVEFEGDAQYTLFDWVRMQDELAQIIGREMDIVSRRGIETSRNYLRKQEILNSAEVLYGA